MRFNIKNPIVNFEGAPSYMVSPEMELYTLMVTSLLSPKFYSDNDMERIRLLVADVAPEFAAKLAVYTRKVMNIRSAPLVILLQLAKLYSGNSIVKKAIGETISRPDEMGELLSLYQISTGRQKLCKIPAQIKKGICRAAIKFDEYQYSKWNKNGNVTLKDVILLCCPASFYQAGLLKKVVTKKLSIAYTWETEMSTKLQDAGQHILSDLRERYPDLIDDKETSLNRAMGTLWKSLDSGRDELWKSIKLYVKCQKNQGKSQIWKNLIDSGRLPYQAALYNLRNMMYVLDEDYIEKVAYFLTSKAKNSKMFPFRFLVAHQEISKAFKNKPEFSEKFNIIVEALEISMRNTMENIKIDGKTLIAADVSGSMHKPISKSSKICNVDIALLLGLMCNEISADSKFGIFGTDWCLEDNVPGNNIFDKVNYFYKNDGKVGYSTNGHLVVEYALSNEIKFDNIMIFTDCILWDSENRKVNSIVKQWKNYKDFNPSAKLYLFDLSGYGKYPLEILKNDVYLIAGWNDEIFNVLENLRNGKTALENVNKIELRP